MRPPKIPVTLSHPAQAGARALGNALIDSGSGMSFCDPQTADALGLPKVGAVEICGIHAHETKKVRRVSLEAPGTPAIELDVIEGGDLKTHHGVIAIIGRDILRRCLITEKGCESFELGPQE